MTFEEFCKKEFVNVHNEAVVKLLRKTWEAGREQGWNESNQMKKESE